MVAFFVGFVCGMILCSMLAYLWHVEVVEKKTKEAYKAGRRSMCPYKVEKYTDDWSPPENWNGEEPLDGSNKFDGFM